MNTVVRLNAVNPRVYAGRAEIYYARKEYDNAVRDVDRAIELAPNTAAYYGYRGNLFGLLGHMSRAVSDYEACLRLSPDHIATLNNLAWVLAACPDEEFRDGSRAVTLAQRACELTDWQKPWTLGTLAAAYAETGRYELAAEHQTTALSLVDEAEKESYRKPLQGYRAGKPRREQFQAPS